MEAAVPPTQPPLDAMAPPTGMALPTDTMAPLAGMGMPGDAMAPLAGMGMPGDVLGAPPAPILSLIHI